MNRVRAAIECLVVIIEDSGALLQRPEDTVFAVLSRVFKLLHNIDAHKSVDAMRHRVSGETMCEKINHANAGDPVSMTALNSQIRFLASGWNER